MEHVADLPATRGRRAFEREMTLVREAIVMVATGRSRRVTVAGLRFGIVLLAAALGLADEAGVRVIPLWLPGDLGADIAVEPLLGE